jgi:hypothetical protein
MQNLETDAQVEGLFRCIRKHLAPGGACVLNVFRPLHAAGEWRERWLAPGERLSWEVPVAGGKVACFDRRVSVDEQHPVLYPDLVYRRYEGLPCREVVLHLVMRSITSAFESLISGHGFQVLNRWGGYEGEAYGEGPELVVQFQPGGLMPPVAIPLARSQWAVGVLPGGNPLAAKPAGSRAAEKPSRGSGHRAPFHASPLLPFNPPFGSCISKTE